MVEPCRGYRLKRFAVGLDLHNDLRSCHASFVDYLGRIFVSDQMMLELVFVVHIDAAIGTLDDVEIEIDHRDEIRAFPDRWRDDIYVVMDRVVGGFIVDEGPPMVSRDQLNKRMRVGPFGLVPSLHGGEGGAA